MADSILFDEKPVKKKKGKQSKKRSDKNELAILLSDEKNQFEKDINQENLIQKQNSGVDLFANNDSPSTFSKTKEKTTKKKVLTAEEFANENPIVKNYIFLVHPQNFSISKEDLIIKIDESVQQTFLLIDQFFKTTIQQENKEIDDGKAKLSQKIEKISQNKQLNFHQKAAKILYLDLSFEFNEIKEKHIQSISDGLVKSIEYAKLVHAEDPTVDIKINSHEIENDINNFPYNNPEAKLVFSHKSQLKRHFHKLKTLEMPKPTHQQLKLLCKSNNYEEAFNYFSDDGDNLTIFDHIVDQLPNEFQKKIESRIEHCVKSPNSAGNLIVLSSKELCEMKRLNSAKDLPYIFLYFARHFFNDIYLNSLFSSMLPSNSKEFSERVQRLRNIPPIGFGFAQKYLVPNLVALRLKDFPPDHMYKESTELFFSSSFYVNPIDFCRKIFEAFQKIQIVASNFEFEFKKKETGQLFAKSDSLLSFDDLFDISLIVFLLSGVGDTYLMTEAFSPFIYGMGLPSEFEFTFTNLHEICEQIAKMDIDKYMDDAMERTARDQEIDPLMISDYVKKK